MIAQEHLAVWSQTAPWMEAWQVEQDLIISRAIVEIFNDAFLREELRFRGGTSLNKLHFPEPMRYSEDIDVVRTTKGPIGPILNRLREVLQPWLGQARFNRSRIAPGLRFSIAAQDSSLAKPLILKIEINTRETEAYGGSPALPYKVDNPWFSGETIVQTYVREEMLATKLRALLARNKGRDLFDLFHALEVFEGLDPGRVVGFFQRYAEREKRNISRAEAEERMFAKLENPKFLEDMLPLLPEERCADFTDDMVKAAFSAVFAKFVVRLPGEPWKKTEEMAERYGVALG